jgi:Xaa-Pro aminopeptidase
LVTFIPHLRWASGFTGSNGVALVTKKNAYFVTDGRYEEQVKREVHGLTTAIAFDYNLYELINKKRWFRPGMRIGFDGNTVSLSQFQDWKKKFPKVFFRPRAEVMEKLIVSKDENEIANIKRAVEITDKVFADVLPLLKPGVVEADIAAEITYRHRKYGAASDAFESIVASGANSALPHARASSKKIKKGDMVTLDFGCVYNGYHSDMTRTVAVGKPAYEMLKIYQVVLDAQKKAIEAAHAEMKVFDLDAVARNHIKEKGYGKFYNHSLGHGIGLQIHEPPKISWTNKTAVLKEGCVVTIEPGIYLPQLGGVRIEDDVVIRNINCEVLTQSPKELIIL